MAERESRASPLTILGDGLLLVCAAAGFAGSFLSLYGDATMGGLVYGKTTPLSLCAQRLDSFLAISVLFALTALWAWSLPKFREVAAGGLAAMLGAAAILNRDAVFQGTALTIRTISEMFSRRVGGRSFLFDPGLTPSQESAAVRVFLVLALAFLALALGWAVVRARRWWVVLALTLPPLLPGLLADLFPDWPLFMALAACWCAMLLTDLCKWAAPSSRGTLTLAALACVSAVLALITLAFPRTGYTRPQWALELETGLYNSANRAIDFFARFEGPFGRRTTYVGSAGEADLSSAGPLNYTGRTVLRVRSDYAGRLYLRGASLAAYEDGIWTPLPEGVYQDYLDRHSAAEDADFSPLLFPAIQGRAGTQYTATVDNVGAVGSYVYTPYFLTSQDWDAAGMRPMEDSYFARLQGQTSFTVAFQTVAFLDRHPSNAASQAERAYYGLLQEQYLDVPEEVRGVLNELFSSASGRSAAVINAQDPIETAWNVAFILNDLCEYDQSVSAPPEGVDPVVYFLTESRRGYCMHFASAATLMLRWLGIPARYVGGFAAQCEPDRQVIVPDRAAHAWVEIYLTGFGWYPVEVTPAAAFDWERQGLAVPEDLPSDQPEESEEPEPSPTPSQDPASSEEPSAAPEEGHKADGPDLTVLFTVLKRLAFIAGAAALFWLGQYLPKRLRARRLNSPDPNRGALYGYGCLLRMERWGGRVDQRAVELAQKARFSQHTLTQEELDELRRLVDTERERLCIVLSPAARLAFRYLWGMPGKPKKRGNAEKSQENSP